MKNISKEIGDTSGAEKTRRKRETKIQFTRKSFKTPAHKSELDDILLSSDVVRSDDESDYIEPLTNAQCSVVDIKKNLKDKCNFSKIDQHALMVSAFYKI